MSNTKATIITIGDELLIGQVVDTNSAWIAQELNKLGIEVLRRIAVGDNRDAILTAIDEELGKATLLVITGGLGPTSDDISKPLLSEYFGGKLVVNEIVLEHIMDIFAKRKRPFLERNMKQAEVPDNCTVLFNSRGTAPGMWFDKDKKVVISLPGVPFEMKGIMEDEVLPRLQNMAINEAIEHKTIFTAGEGESFIAEQLIEIEDVLPEHIKLAYLPNAGMVRLRLTGKGIDKDRLKAELTHYQKMIADRLGNIVVALEDLPLEVILGRSLKAAHKTIGIGESCTGGYIAHCLTQIPGSSSYFIGDIIPYNISVKKSILGVKAATLEQFGAVSEETAKEMAIGVLKQLDTDIAVSVTGLLGPDSDGETVPIGTVWIAVADKDTIYTKRFRFPYDRQRNKEMASMNAMLLAWKFVEGKL